MTTIKMIALQIKKVNTGLNVETDYAELRRLQKAYATEITSPEKETIRIPSATARLLHVSDFKEGITVRIRKYRVDCNGLRSRAWHVDNIQGFVFQRYAAVSQIVHGTISKFKRRLEVGTMTLTAARSAKKLDKAAQERLSKLDKITVKAAKDMLRSYQAEMIDLSSISIPEIGLQKVVLSHGDVDLIKNGGQVQVTINGQPVIITAL